MNIKYISHKVMRRAFAALLPVAGTVAAALTLTSCDDFLTLEPLNEIVDTKFWKEENDVTKSLAACYALMENEACIQRMMVWGELRSDNVEAGSSVGSDVQQVLKENILETNGFTKWDSFYKVINQCNIVMHYAPIVAGLDPNFTASECKATIAEAMTLRTLSYFYLIRAFRDVPYVTEPSLEDDQDFVVPATKFDAVLDSLIRDMEGVKNDAVRSYGEYADENYSRVTRWACYALLADLYLWKGDYQKCIDYCDMIIARKIYDYEYMKEDDPNSRLLPELYYDYFPLISETESGGNDAGNAYERIFGEGLSFESIFELNFQKNKSSENKAVASYYGSTDNNGQWAVPSYFTEQVDNNTNEYFRRNDCRYVENIRVESSKNYISKYVNQSISFRVSLTASTVPTATTGERSDNYANWIIYRLTDVMLMRAEAEIELAGEIDSEQGITEEQTAHYHSAWVNIMAVWRRAHNMRTVARDTLVYSDYASSRRNMENLVFAERQRELMFEGKRWFDLVRLSRRDGDNARMIAKVLPKFKQDQSSIRIRLSAQDALYWPYNREEMKVNKYLIQNAAYKTGENWEKN